MKTDTARAFTRMDWALIALVMLLAIFARALPGPRSIDDSFITFRYSRNIVEGRGFVYNPDSHVLGTTTPLYTVLMAAISAVTRGQDYPWYALTVNALADAGTCAMLFLLARRLTDNRWLAALLGSLWAIAAWSVTFAVGGMETSLNIFWLVGAAYWLVSGRAALLGLFAGLGFLTRIDDLIWIGPMLAYQGGEWLVAAYRQRRQQATDKPARWQAAMPLIRTWAALGLVVLPWLVFSFAYFGSPVPGSLSAKSKSYFIEPNSALKILLPIYATPFFEKDVLGVQGAMLAGLAYLILNITGIIYAARKLPRLLPLLAYPWFYFIVFSVANPLIFRWYLAPPLPGLMLGIVAGVWSILAVVQKVLARTDRRKLLTPITLAALALFWGSLSINAWDRMPDHEPFRPAPKPAWHKIELLYQQVATALREQCGVTADTRVASADIGAVGYFSSATIIDTVGLVTPALSKYYPASADLLVPGQNYVIPPALINDTQPTYFVTMEAFVRLGLEKDATFKANYTLMKEIPTDFYGTGMLVYGRNGSARAGCLN